MSGASGVSTAWMDVEVATRSAGVYLALLVLGAKAPTDAARNVVVAMVNLTIVIELFQSNFCYRVKNEYEVDENARRSMSIGCCMMMMMIPSPRALLLLVQTMIDQERKEAGVELEVKICSN